jgi:hypothetical protein
MKHYPVQITTNIQNKDNPIIFDFIKSIDYKIKGNGDFKENTPHFIQYRFSYTNAVKFMKLLENLGYLFEIALYVKTVNGILIYE